MRFAIQGKAIPGTKTDGLADVGCSYHGAREESTPGRRPSPCDGCTPLYLLHECYRTQTPALSHCLRYLSLRYLSGRECNLNRCCFCFLLATEARLSVVLRKWVHSCSSGFNISQFFLFWNDAGCYTVIRWVQIYSKQPLSHMYSLWQNALDCIICGCRTGRRLFEEVLLICENFQRTRLKSGKSLLYSILQWKTTKSRTSLLLNARTCETRSR